MDEKQRNFFRESDKDSHRSASSDMFNDHQRDSETSEVSEQAGAGDRYYYAYGPYQSVKRDEASCETTSTEPADCTGNEQVTLSTSVKPLTFSSATQQGGFTVRGKQGKEADQFTSSTHDWNFNVLKRSSGTSFKGVLVSIMVGVLVVTTSMVIADKTNLFTGSTARGDQEVVESAAFSNVVSADSSKIPFPNGANSVADVVEKVSPAVVKIETFAKGKVNRGRGGSSFEDPFFQEFFERYFGNDSSSESSRQHTEPELQQIGSGSGFIFHKKGYIFTNQHVIEHGGLIRVIVKDQKEPFTAEVIGHSKELDLAVLKIKRDGDFSTVSLGNSDATRIGEQLIAIGNPLGFDHTVTTGVLSARERELPSFNDGESTRSYKHMLQTEASINPGNSGGPLLNMKGEVIGMNTALARSAQGIGFAISSNVMSKVVDHLKNGREVPREPVPFIGAQLITMTDDVASYLNISPIKGSLVRMIEYGSPAYEADLQMYDIITGIDGTKYTTSEELIEQIRKKKVGDNVTLQIVRKGKAMDIKVKIGDKNKFSKKLEQ